MADRAVAVAGLAVPLHDGLGTAPSPRVFLYGSGQPGGLVCSGLPLLKRCRMDVVTQSLLKEFAESQKIDSLGQSDQFEAFINYIVVSDIYPEVSAVEDQFVFRRW